MSTTHATQPSCYVVNHPWTSTTAEHSSATFAFELLFNAAQGIHWAHESIPPTFALPLWKTHAAYILTALTHGATELAHTELPTFLTLQQDVQLLAHHLDALLASSTSHPQPTLPTPKTPTVRTIPDTPHIHPISTPHTHTHPHTAPPPRSELPSPRSVASISRIIVPHETKG